MKNLKFYALSTAAAAIFTFLFSGCDKAETAGNVSATVQTSVSENASQAAITAQATPKNQAGETENLLFLREWIGKYPFNKNDVKYADVFSNPQIKNLLARVAGQNNLPNLRKHFAAPDLIEEIGGFVKIFGTTGRKADGKIGYGLIAVKPETAETHVFLVDDGKLTAFSSAKNGGTLPAEIKQSILIYTGQTEIIGKIKQRPDPGYLCYAVSFKDWDAPQATRPYIFYITDTGGRMNVGGADIELKQTGDTERAGENGKTYVEWIYENKDARARFDLVVSEIPDSSAVIYDGTVTVTTAGKSQTAQIKAFCGG